MESTLKYAKSLIGTKYIWWKKGSTSDNIYPYYVDAPKNKEYIKENGINCVGFINVLRHKNGKSIPGTGKMKGGTYSWYNHLKEKDVLQDLDDNHDYPLGTLFLRKYRNINDQGHMAIYFDKDKTNKPLYGKIIHAYPLGSESGQLGITSFGTSHFTCKGGYYEYAILPEDWILSE